MAATKGNQNQKKKKTIDKQKHVAKAVACIRSTSLSRLLSIIHEFIEIEDVLNFLSASKKPSYL